MVSVSVIAKESVIADAYATAIVVMGSEKGLKLVNDTENMECIIVKKDNTILVSEGAENFMLTSHDYEMAEE